MKFLTLLVITLLLTACNPQRQGEGIDSKAVFGEDERHEVYEAEKKHRKWARSTAGMFPNEELKKAMKGEPITPLSEAGVTIFLPGAFFPIKGKVCEEMKYREQPVGAHCSGFLVGPDLLVTAGHCVTSQADCENRSWVFDFKLKKNGKLRLYPWNVYKCKEIVEQQLTWAEPHYDPQEMADYEKCVEDYGGPGSYGTHSHCQHPNAISWDYTNEADYALIRLNRKAWFRKPFKFRTEGEIESGAKVTVIGHPLGLPSKVTTGGEVLDKSYPHSFTVNTDAFKGNSGSAVINQETGVVEGILVRGWDPFVHDKERDCYKINPFDQFGTEVPQNTQYPITRKDLLTGVNKIMSIEALMDLSEN